MAITAAQLIASIAIQGADSARSTLSGVGAAATSTGNIFKSALGGAIGIAASGAGMALDGLKNVVEDSIQVAMKHQVVETQTAAVLRSTKDASGETAASIDQMSTALSRQTMFSKDTIQTGENMLLTFTGIGKQVFPQATQAMLDLSQATGQSMTSSAMQLGKALGDPLKGMSALQRVGVTFSEDEQKQIKTMMAHNDVMGAQKVMLKELETEFGGSATAAGKTFAGQMAILQNNMDDFKESLGEAILPMLSSFVSFITSNVMPIINAFGDWFTGTAIPNVQRFLAQFVPFQHAFDDTAAYILVLQGTFAQLFGAIGSFIGSLINQFSGLKETFSIGNIIGNAREAIADLADFINNAAIALTKFISHIDVKAVANDIKSTFNTIVSIGQGVVNVVQAIINAFNSPFVKSIIKDFQDMANYLGATFKPVIDQLVITWKTQLLPAFQQLLPALAPIGAIIGGVIVVAFGLLIGIITGVIKAVAGFLTGWAQAFGGIIQIISGAVSIIGNLLKLIWDLFHGNWSAVAADAKGMLNGLVQIIQGIGNTIVGVFRALWGTISGLVSGFVDGVIGFFTHLATTLVGHSIIPDMINSIVQWFQGLPAKVLTFITNLVTQAISTFTNFATRIGTAASNIVTTVVNWFSQLPSRAVTAISSLETSVANYFSGLASSAYSWGSNMVQSIINGINSMVGAAGQAAQNVINNVKSFLGFHSPSEKGEGRYIIQWGEGMIKGFEQGIQNATPHLLSTVNLAVASSMKPINPGAFQSTYTPTIQTNSAPINITVQPAPVTLNGQVITNAIMPTLSQSVRYNLGTHHI